MRREHRVAGVEAVQDQDLVELRGRALDTERTGQDSLGEHRRTGDGGDHREPGADVEGDRLVGTCPAAPAGLAHVVGDRRLILRHLVRVRKELVGLGVRVVVVVILVEQGHDQRAHVADHRELLLSPQGVKDLVGRGLVHGRPEVGMEAEVVREARDRDRVQAALRDLEAGRGGRAVL